MNTNLTIPTAFSAETVFSITLGDVQNESNAADELSKPRRFATPSEEEFLRRGIPESALHD